MMSETNRTKAVRIHEIVTGDQLGLDFGGVDFWTDRPVSELISEAGAIAVENPADLEVSGVTKEAWSALYEALGITGCRGSPAPVDGGDTRRAVRDR